MPKERRDCATSRSRTSPFPCGSSPSLLSLIKNPLENEEHVKEWEEARCPVCIEHPHNSILLLCSSHGKGCRPFMCDTSYRHSNCFDQFCKSFGKTPPTVPQQEETSLSTATDSPTYRMTLDEGTPGIQAERIESRLTHTDCENKVKGKLVCPLCRGDINGWMVVEPARVFMNAKLRSCACETCDFSGTYSDLRKHARLAHPLVRPSEADPERQRDWRRLERQRDLGDLISTLQSSIGEDRSEDSAFSLDERGLLTVFFLVRVFQPGNVSRSSSWSGTSRARAHVTVRRRSTRTLWGESIDEEDSLDQDNDTSDGASGPSRSQE